MEEQKNEEVTKPTAWDRTKAFGKKYWPVLIAIPASAIIAYGLGKKSERESWQDLDELEENGQVEIVSHDDGSFTVTTKELLETSSADNENDE